MSDALVAMPDDALGRMALIEAVRANTDAVSRMAGQSEALGAKMDRMNESIHGLDRRISLIENNTVERDLERMRSMLKEQEASFDNKCEALDVRVTELEGERNRRIGALGFVEWIGKNWPAVIGFVFIVVLLVTRKFPF